jgi:glycosyltransferase involved in cell wall biosynthesis
MRNDHRPTVSIIIKALNEERHIAAAIESALAALDGLEGEVILADSLSTDRTVAIAKKYPIKIVHFESAVERSCGAGAQLGYQYSSGKYICLMDGDMRLIPGFLAAGVGFLDGHPDVGGVGGAVLDREIRNLEYQQRAKRADPDRRPGRVSRLHSFGLYRRSAIEALGYVTDRNLHAGEELDLAARLDAAGWTLHRIDCPAVDHYVHTQNAYRLLLRRMKTRYAWGPGEILRAAVGRSHFRYILAQDRNLMLSGLVALWWASLATVAMEAGGTLATWSIAGLAVLPFAFMTWRWRSLRNAIYSVAVWNVHALCFVPGFLRARKPPAQWIASVIVKDTPCRQSGASGVPGGVSHDELLLEAAANL